VLSWNFSQRELIDPSQEMFVSSLEKLDLVLKLLPNCLDKSLRLVYKDKLVVKDELVGNKDKLV
jgi:hypothetical protein